MKIKRYNSGGGIIYTPFVSSRGVPQNSTETPSTSTSKKDEDSEWLEKEYVKMIQHNGLISDVNQTMDKMKQWYIFAKNMSKSYLMGGENQYDVLSQMFDIQKEINANKRMQDSWTQAQQNAYNQGALGEVATTPGGNIYVWTKDGITSVTPEEYNKNKGTGTYVDYNEDGSDYLTNSELLDIRERYIPGNTNLINNVGSAKGLSTITKEIRDIIKEFGNESITEYIKRTGNKISQSAWDGIQILIGEGPDGYYKATTKTERRYLNEAFEYLLESIGAPSRNKLRAVVAARGGNPNNAEEVYGLILNALTIHTDYTQEPTFEKGATEYDPDGDGTGSSTQLTEDDLAERYLSGSGAPPPKYEILMTSKSGVPMYAYVQNLGGILNSSGNASLGDANLEDVFTNGYSLSTDVDKKSITFGDQLIDWSDASKIVYDSSTSLKRVYLPARNVNGRITPDFEMYKTISQLNEKFKDLDAGTIKDYLAENYPALDYDEKNKMIIAKDTQLFLTFGGIASTDTFSKDMSKSDWLIHDESIDRKWKDKYNSLTGFRSNTSIGTKSATTGNKETKNGWMPWNWGYDFYKGNVFVAVTDPMLASMIHNNQYWSKDTYRAMTQKAEAAMRESAREQQSQLKLTF